MIDDQLISPPTLSHRPHSNFQTQT